MSGKAKREDFWPVVPIEDVRRGAVVMLPTDVDGDRVRRWIGPIRVASIRRAPASEAEGRGAIAVVHWHGGGSLVLTGRLYAAGARREPSAKAVS